MTILLLVSCLNTKRFLILIVLVVDENEDFDVSRCHAGSEPQSDGYSLCGTQLQPLFPQLQEIVAVGSHEKHLLHPVRIRKRDLLVASLAAAYRKRNVEGFVDDRMPGYDAHEPTPDQLVELRVNDVDVDALAAGLQRPHADVDLLECVGGQRECILRLHLHLHRVRRKALNQPRRLRSSGEIGQNVTSKRILTKELLNSAILILHWALIGGCSEVES